jgi:hypothetical protein
VRIDCKHAYAVACCVLSEARHLAGFYDVRMRRLLPHAVVAPPIAGADASVAFPEAARAVAEMVPIGPAGFASRSSLRAGAAASPRGTSSTVHVHAHAPVPRPLSRLRSVSRDPREEDPRCAGCSRALDGAHRRRLPSDSIF